MTASAILDTLPQPLRDAQNAIGLTEVVEAMKMLSKYGLGICMPHLHTDSESGFSVLPVGMRQVERDQLVTFEPESAASDGLIPVAWRYEETHGVARIAECGCCRPSTQGDGRHNV